MCWRELEQVASRAPAFPVKQAEEHLLGVPTGWGFPRGCAGLRRVQCLRPWKVGGGGSVWEGRVRRAGRLLDQGGGAESFKTETEQTKMSQKS